jgi:hypothetical protein
MSWFGNEEDTTQEDKNKAFLLQRERTVLLHLSDSLGLIARRELWGRERKTESLARVAQAAPLGGIK